MSPPLIFAATALNLLIAVLASGAQAVEAATPAPVNETKPAHTNHLITEKSPYLLQHAHNPVEWYPWGDEAFERAEKEHKPIFLSIGYSTCHWCHVMERESFENQDVANLLNKHFICIKLDREEKPDIDQIYMGAMQALQMGGGWPLNVFITPDRKPFYGGTYFKKDAFIKLADMVATKWQKDSEQIQKDANNIAEELQKAMDQSSLKPGEVDVKWVEAGAKAFSESFDAENGGFGGAPKFPQPQVSALLLLTGQQVKDDKRTQEVLYTLRRMAAGGIYDHLGGGFSRYSVDAQWLVPHFEKMLYDNAQLLDLYLNAYLITKDAQYAAVARDIVRYVLRDMTHPDGGFYSAEDADSEGQEGKFYCWTEAELKALLKPEDFATAVDYFGITAKGNFIDHSHEEPLKGLNILSIVKPEEKAPANLEAIKQQLSEVRAKRVRPHLDDKVLSSWNGLMLGSLVRAAIILEEPSYLAAAKKNLAFVQAKLWDASSKTLYHRFREGERDQDQLLTAYAFYLHGTIELYQATLDPVILDFAHDLTQSMVEKFYDPKHGGFFTNDGQKVIFMVKDDYDGAEPSGSAVAIFDLLKMAAIMDNEDLRAKADLSLRLYAERLEHTPQALPLMLQAASFAKHEPYRVVVVGDPASPETHALLGAAHRVYQPEKVVLGTLGQVEAFAKTLTPKGDKPTIYVCTGKECQLPTTDPKEVAGKLQK